MAVKTCILFLTIFVELMGCAPTLKDVGKETPPLVWPLPPDPPRIRHVETIAEAKDLKAGGSFWKRIWRAIAGPQEMRLGHPTGIAVDREGNLYISDTLEGALFIFDRKKGNHLKLTQAGDGEFSSPMSVAVDDERGVCYVADSVLGRVFALSKKGKLIRAIGQNVLMRPTGLSLGAGGTLYVADALQHSIIVFTPEGDRSFSFGKRGDGDGEFNFPTHIAHDRNNRVYVVDSLNSRIQVFDGRGTFIGKFGQAGDGSGDFGKPKGIALDSEGHIYVVDALFDTVQIFDPRGHFLLSFGSTGRGNGEFYLPSGIFILENDTIYVADTYNGRIQVFHYLR